MRTRVLTTLLVIAASAHAEDLDVTCDTLSVKPGSREARASGHVAVRSATVSATGDEGEIFYEEAPGGGRRVSSVALRGNARLVRTSDGAEATGEVLRYERAGARLVIDGEGGLHHGRDEIHAPHLELGLEDDSLTASDASLQVRRGRDEKPIHIEARRLTIDKGGRHARLEGNVRARQGDVSVNGESGEAWLVRAGNDIATVSRLAVWGKVRAQKGTRKGSADRAEWKAESDELVLEGKPVLEQDDGVLSGARIVVDLRSGTAHVTGANARIRP